MTRIARTIRMLGLVLAVAVAALFISAPATARADTYPLQFIDADGTNDGAITANVYTGDGQAIPVKLKNTSSETVYVSDFLENPTGGDGASVTFAHKRTQYLDWENTEYVEDMGYAIQPGATAQLWLYVEAGTTASYNTYQLQFCQDYYQMVWEYDPVTDTSTGHFERHIVATNTANIPLKLRIYNPQNATLQVGTSNDLGATISQFPASGIDLGTYDLSTTTTVELGFYIKNTTTTVDPYTGAIPEIDEEVTILSDNELAGSPFAVPSGKTYHNGNRYISLSFNAGDLVAGTYTASLTIQSVPCGVTVNGVSADAAGRVTIPVKVTLTGTNPRLAPRVTGLVATPGNGQVELNWDDVEGVSVVWIWRRVGVETHTDPDKIDWSLYQEVGERGRYSTYATRFVDNTAENGVTYSYVVLSGASAGPYRGYASKAATVTPDSSLAVRLPAPDFDSANGYVGYVELEWDLGYDGNDGRDEERIDHFNVYCDGRLVAQVDVSAVIEEVSTDGTRRHSWVFDYPLDDVWELHNFRVSSVGVDGSEGYLSDSQPAWAEGGDVRILDHQAWFSTSWVESVQATVPCVFAEIGTYSSGSTVETIDVWRSVGTTPPDTSAEPYMTVDKNYVYSTNAHDIEDVNVEANKTYTYTVRANNDDGQVSDFYTFTVKAITGVTFSTPEITYSIENDTTPTLSFWSRWDQIDGSPITYRFYRNDALVDSFCGLRSHTFSDTPTTDGTYVYRVDVEIAGITVRGRDYTFTRDTTPPDTSAFPKPPDAPTLGGRVSATPNSTSGIITISWTPAEGGGEVEGYHIYRKDAGTFVEGRYRMHAQYSSYSWYEYWGMYRYLDVPASTNSLAEVSGPYLGNDDLGQLIDVYWYESYTPHEYYVTAYNQYGESAPSNMVTFPYAGGNVPLNGDAEASGAPAISRAWIEWQDDSNNDSYVNAGTFDENPGYTIRVAWDEPEDAATTVGSYRVTFDDGMEVSSSAVARWRLLTDPEVQAGTSAYSPTYRVYSGYEEDFNKDIQVTVYAVNEAGETASVPVTVPVEGPPLIQVRNDGGTAVVRWADPVYSTATVTGWELYRRPEHGLLAKVGEFASDVHEYTDTDVRNGWTYEYFVVAKTSQGDRQSATASRLVSSSATGIPGAPTNLSATVVNGRVVLSWERPANEGEIFYYAAEIRISGSDEWVSNGDYVTGCSEGMCLAMRDNYLDKDVEVRVFAVNDKGEGERSNVATFRITSDQAASWIDGWPGVVTPSGDSGSGWCRVTWSTSTETNCAPATHYRVMRDGVTIATVAAKGEGAYDYEYVDTNVVNGTSYTYQIDPYNGSYHMTPYDDNCVILTPTGKSHDQEVAEAVAEMIAGLPAPDDVSSEDIALIREVAAIWDGLTDDQQKLVKGIDRTLPGKLADDVEAADELELLEQYEELVAPVQELIDALPDAADVTLADEAQVAAARAAYEALSPAEAKRLVKTARLVAAEGALAAARQHEADQAAADVVSARIDALPAVDELTLGDAAAVEAARAAYDALTDAQRALVPAGDVAALEAAEARIAALRKEAEDIAAAEAVGEAIAALPAPADVALADAEAIAAARTAYDALSEEAKALVTNYDVLVAAEEALAAIVPKTDISPAVVTAPDVPWDGTPQEPEVTVTLGGAELEGGVDYVLSYADNVEMGVASVTVTGVGAYEGAATGTFLVDQPFCDVFPRTDTSSGTSHYEDIMWLYSTGITRGWKTYPNREYRGMSDVQRADMAAFLYRLAVLAGAADPDWQPTEEDMGRFVDVHGPDANGKGATPHYREIWWLASVGVSTGWAVKDASGEVVAYEFRPSSYVTRQDMAAFLHRLAEGPKATYVPTDEDRAYFSDVNDRTPHHDDIWWLANAGVTRGWTMGDGSHEFRGMSTVKRQDMAAFLHRMDGKVARFAG